MALRFLALVLISLSFFASASQQSDIRAQYAKPQALWPSPITADGEAPAPLKPLLPVSELPNDALVALGKSLFNDKMLSRDHTKSCASCHIEEKTFQDGLAQAVGVDGQVGSRNTPPIFGIDHWGSFFWDGRASTAEEQSLMPIANPIEMDLPISEALERLNQSEVYTQLFEEVMGANEITGAMLAEALVAFERTIPAPQTRFQAFITQAQTAPAQAIELLTDTELHGLHLFRTKAKCMTCHEGALLSDNEFHVTGFSLYGRPFEDLGRVEATQDTNDIGKFRTPSLLGVTHTAPWMHNGLFTQLTPMIMQYNAGGFRPKPKGKFVNDPNFPSTTDLIEPLGLTKPELSALVEFLHTL